MHQTTDETLSTENFIFSLSLGVDTLLSLLQRFLGGEGHLLNMLNLLYTLFYLKTLLCLASLMIKICLSGKHQQVDFSVHP